MKKILVEKLPRIIKAKKKIERDFNIKVTNRGKEIYIDGSPQNEYIAGKAIDAIDFGFSIAVATSMKKEELDFEKVNIKGYTHSKNLERVRGRIIGTSGKSLQTLSNLTNCYFERNGNNVGIIGAPEDIPIATEAVIMLAQGAKHGNVYKNIERNRPKMIPDLGLKESKE